MEKLEKIKKENLPEEDLGFLMWQLQEIENFYPCFKTMLKRDD